MNQEHYLLPPGSLLEMQNLSAHPRPTESKSAFNKICRLFACTLRFEKHCVGIYYLKENESNTMNITNQCK